MVVSTALDGHPILIGCLGERIYEVDQAVLVQELDPVLFKLSKAPLDFPIEVSHADNGAAGVSFQCTRDMPVGLLMEMIIGDAAEEDRIISPNNSAGSDALGKSLEGGDCQVHGRCAGINCSRVGHERVQEVVAVAAVIQL